MVLTDCGSIEGLETLTQQVIWLMRGRRHGYLTERRTFYRRIERKPACSLRDPVSGHCFDRSANPDRAPPCRSSPLLAATASVSGGEHGRKIIQLTGLRCLLFSLSTLTTYLESRGTFPRQRGTTYDRREWVKTWARTNTSQRIGRSPPPPWLHFQLQTNDWVDGMDLKGELISAHARHQDERYHPHTVLIETVVGTEGSLECRRGL